VIQPRLFYWAGFAPEVKAWKCLYVYTGYGWQQVPVKCGYGFYFADVNWNDALREDYDFDFKNHAGGPPYYWAGIWYYGEDGAWHLGASWQNW
jgi:hypothetical protein